MRISNVKILIVCGAAWVAIVLVALSCASSFVSASGEIENGFFEGQTGWAWDGAVSYASGVSQDGAGGSAEMYCGGQLVSAVFVPSSSSNLSYYATSSPDAAITAFVLDYTSNTVTNIHSGVSVNSSWSEKTYSLSGFAGHKISLGLYGNDCGRTYHFDSFTVSNGSALGAVGEGSLNGTFYAGASGWSGASWSGSIGHNAVGAARHVSGCGNEYARSIVFVVGASVSWDVWARGQSGGCNGIFKVNVIDYDSSSGVGFVSLLDTTLSLNDTWQEFDLNLAGLSGHRVAFMVITRGVDFDDLCSSVLCLEGTATPTPSITPTSIPTSTPIPTSTSAPTPTSVPVGTPVSGGGSGGLCPPTDPCYVIVENTPLPVDLIGVGGTPVSSGGGIPIQGGNSTPVIVSFPTVEITPISGASAGVSVSGAVPIYNSASSSGVMPIGSAGGNVGVGDVVGVAVDENVVSGCLPDAVNQVVNVGENGCVSFPVKTLTEYKLLGVDIAPYFLVIAGVMFVVFIIRQLQEK